MMGPLGTTRHGVLDNVQSWGASGPFGAEVGAES